MAKNIISSFKEKPKTNTAWWSMGFGLGLFLIPLLSVFFRGFSLGPINVIPFLLFPLLACAITMIVIAFKKGERSFVVWIGLLPIILFLVLLVAEFLFIE